MNLTVRRASLIEDREEMLELLNRNFEKGQEKRFEWRHLNHPAGQAWCWFVYDRDSKATVATASVFPRRMFVDGRVVLVGQVGGFAVDAAYRSLGPAVLMQRATFEPADSGAVVFCYDSPPHDRGMSTFVRLGMRPNCEVSRYALALRSDEFLQGRLGKSAWTKPLIATTNLLLRIRRAKRPTPELEISELYGAFDEEFTQIDRLVPSAGMVRASRSAEVLNWCYLQNPGSEFRVLVARQAGELLGYLTSLVCGERVTIIDVFGRQLQDVGAALVDALVDRARQEKRVLVEGYSSDGSELKSIFCSLGFRRRETAARVVAYERSNGQLGKLLNSGSRWAFSYQELVV